MSQICPAPDKSTTSEAALLTALNNLSNSGAGEFLTKSGGTIVNGTPTTGSSSFISLTDAPSSYIGKGGYTVKVNAAATGLDFVNVSSGSGTVTSVSVATANGISGVVATETTTPAITLTLGVITPTSVNGLTLTAAAVGFTIAGGTTSKTLTVGADASVSGTNTGDGTYGIADTNYVKIDAADVADNDYAKFTANGLEGRSYSEVKQDLDLEVGTDIAAQTHASQHAVSGSDSVFPADPGADRYLMWDDDPGQLVWATVSGTGASTALDNLASVAINTSLISDTTNTDDLGSSTKLWKDLFVTNIGATATRVTKGWFTDIESTNMPTVGGTAILSSLTAPQFTTIELGHASDTTLSRSAAGVLAVEGVNLASTASPTFTGTVTLADNCRIDLTLPTADGYATGPTTDSFNAGYSSAVGDLVFFGTGGKWLEADADAIATCGTLLGIALEAKADTEAMKVALPGSMVRLDAWNWNVGKCLYASETLGGISESIPTGADGVVKVVGVSLSADAIYFYPSQDHSTTVS